MVLAHGSPFCPHESHKSFINFITVVFFCFCMLKMSLAESEFFSES